MVGTITAWVLLGISCVYDLAYKRIPLFLVICGGIIGGILTWCNGATSVEVFGALLPGSIMLFVSYFTHEKVGYGDGMLLVVLGLLEGVGVCLWDMGIGLVMLVLFAAVMLLVKKADGKTLIPFAPFLLAAHTLSFFVGV